MAPGSGGNTSAPCTTVALCTLGIVLVLLCLWSFPNGAIGFTTNVRVDDLLSGNSRSPSVAVAPNGHRFVLFFDDRNGNDDIFISRSTDLGGSFGADIRVDNSIGASTQVFPALAVDSQGTLHAVWQDSRGGSNRIYYSRSIDDGLSWSANVPVNTSAMGTQASPDIAIDPSDVLHVVWEDSRTGSTHLYHARSTGVGTFDGAVRVDSGAAGTTQTKCSITVASDGHLHVVWQDTRDVGQGFNIYWATSSTNGTSWPTERRVDDAVGNTAQEEPEVAVLSDGTIVVVWQDRRNGADYDIFSSTSTDGGASFPVSVRLNTLTAVDQRRPSLAVDALDRLELAYDSSASGNLDIKQQNTTVPGGQWAPEVTVNDDGGGSVQSMVSLSTDGQAGVVLAWEDGRCGGSVCLYFAQNSNTLPDPPASVAPADGVWVSTTSPTLSWTFLDADIGDAQTAFTVEVDDAPTFASPTLSTTQVSAIESMTLPVALPDGIYYWRVRTRDSAGEWSLYNTSRQIRVDSTAPTAVAVTDLGIWSTSASITFSWTASSDLGSGVETYLVDVGTTLGGTQVVAGAQAMTLGYNLLGASDGTQYFCRVRARDVAGNVGSYGPSSDGITVDTVAPTIGAGLVVDDGQWSVGPTLHFEWQDATDVTSGVSGYRVDVGITAGGSELLAGSNVLQSSFDLFPIQHGVTYFLRYSAVDVAGNVAGPGPSSDGITVDVLPPVAMTPTDLGEAINDPVVRWDWTDSTDSPSGVAGYWVAVGTLPGAADIASAFVTLPTFQIVNGTSGTRYFATLQALDNAGNLGVTSPSSDGILVDLSPPTGTSVALLTITPVEGVYATADPQNLSLGWTAALDPESGVSSYRYRLVDQDNGTVLVDWNSTGALSAQLGNLGLLDEQRVIGQVVAVNMANATSALENSPPLLVDLTPPPLPTILALGGLPVGSLLNQTQVLLQWSYPSEGSKSSPLRGTEFRIGSTPGGAQYSTGLTTRSELTLSALEHGDAVYVSLRGVDGAGNVGPWNQSSNASIVDLAAPALIELRADGKTTGALASTEVLWSWVRLPDPLDELRTMSFELEVFDGSGVALALLTSANASGVSWEGAEEGETFYGRVRGFDGAGNLGPWSSVAGPFVVDLTAPGIANFSQASYATGPQQPLVLLWSAPLEWGSPLGMTLRLTLWDGSAVSRTLELPGNARSTDALQPPGVDGTYQVQLIASDGAGNQGPSSSSLVVFDSEAPLPPVVTPKFDGSRGFSSSTLLRWGLKQPPDTGALVERWDVQGFEVGSVEPIAEWEVTTPDVELTGLSHAMNVFVQVRAIDSAGNVGTQVTTSPPVIVDLLPPTLPRWIPPDYLATNTLSIALPTPASDDLSPSVTLNLVLARMTCSDALASSIVAMNASVGTVTIVGTPPLEGTPLLVCLTATDIAGNSAIVSHPLLVDRTAPTVGVVAQGLGATGMTNAAAVTLEINASADVAQMRLQATNLGLPLWRPFSPAVTLTQLPEGIVNISVAVRDFAGHESAPANLSFHIDRSAPTLRLRWIDAPDGRTSADHATLAGSTEPGAMVLVDGVAVRTDGKGSFRYTAKGLTGTIEIEVLSQDAAGNVAVRSVQLQRIDALTMVISSGVFSVAALVLALATMAGMMVLARRSAASNARVGRLAHPAAAPAPTVSRAAGAPPQSSEKSQAHKDAVESGPARNGGAPPAPAAPSLGPRADPPAMAAVHQTPGVAAASATQEAERADLDARVERHLDAGVPAGSALPEAPARPRAKIRCVRCATIIPVYSDSRPIRVRCPSCDATGTLRA